METKILWYSDHEGEATVLPPSVSIKKALRLGTRNLCLWYFSILYFTVKETVTNGGLKEMSKNEYPEYCKIRTSLLIPILRAYLDEQDWGDYASELDRLAESILRENPYLDETIRSEKQDME